MPLRPDYDYEKSATIDLTENEAKFLSECILRSPPSSGSLLAFLIKNGKKSGKDSSDFMSVPEDLMPADLQRDYRFAKDFSRFIYGAHIRYNVIFSEYADDAMTEKYNEWRDSFLSEPFALEPVLERVSCKPALAAFCHTFLETVEINDTAAMDDLIVRREIQVKGDRSKLRKPKEYRYDLDHPIHMFELSFRFERAKVIVQDILNGLGGVQNV